MALVKKLTEEEKEMLEEYLYDVWDQSAERKYFAS